MQLALTSCRCQNTSHICNRQYFIITTVYWFGRMGR